MISFHTYVSKTKKKCSFSVLMFLNHWNAIYTDIKCMAWNPIIFLCLISTLTDPYRYGILVFYIFGSKSQVLVVVACLFLKNLICASFTMKTLNFSEIRDNSNSLRRCSLSYFRSLTWILRSSSKRKSNLKQRFPNLFPQWFSKLNGLKTLRITFTVHLNIYSEASNLRLYS